MHVPGIGIRVVLEAEGADVNGHNGLHDFSNGLRNGGKGAMSRGKKGLGSLKLSDVRFDRFPNLSVHHALSSFVFEIPFSDLKTEVRLFAYFDHFFTTALYLYYPTLAVGQCIKRIICMLNFLVGILYIVLEWPGSVACVLQHSMHLHTFHTSVCFLVFSGSHLFKAKNVMK